MTRFAFCLLTFANPFFSPFWSLDFFVFTSDFYHCDIYDLLFHMFLFAFLLGVCTLIVERRGEKQIKLNLDISG